MHVHGGLPALEGGLHQRPDFLDHRVGHRETADRDARSMHHQEAAGAAVGAVKRVRIAEIERQVIAGGRVHLGRRHLVEAFRRLAVAFAHLRPKPSGHGADRPAAEGPERAVRVRDIGGQLGGLLGDPQVDGAAQGQPGCRQIALKLRLLRRVGSVGPAGRGRRAGLGKGEQRGQAEKGERRQQQRKEIWSRSSPVSHACRI